MLAHAQGAPQRDLLKELSEISVQVASLKEPTCSASPYWTLALVGATGSGMDSYGWDWSDLTADQQLAARLDAVHDYDRHGCWDPSGAEDIRSEDVPKGFEKLWARWVDKSSFKGGNL